MSYLQVQGLKKNFGHTEVLKNISFGVARGEVVSVIGSSGGGKTTLLRCLNFLEPLSGGKLSVDGQEIFSADKKYNEKAVRKNRLNFGLVFQNFNLFPQYTALQNIKLPLDLQTKDKCREEKRSKRELKFALYDNAAIAQKLLKEVGLESKANNYPCELSGGQCQRVAIARALALKPKILCFDEPTSALDPELTNEVLRVITDLKSKERVMLVVTHEMQFARDISDRIFFMADGIIEEEGTPDKIFQSPSKEKTRAFLRNYMREDLYD